MGQRGTLLAACALSCAGLAPVASGAGAATAKPRPVVKKVTVADDFYTPTKLAIPKGSSVRWVWSNQNYSTHNVTLIKGPKGIRKGAFTSIDAVAGLSFKRRFTTPGTYHFECTIHPSMNITVLVRR